MTEMQVQGAAEVRGTFEWRDADGKVVGTTEFVWHPSARDLAEIGQPVKELSDDDLGE